MASQATTIEEDKKISIGPRRGGQQGEGDKETGINYYKLQSLTPSRNLKSAVASSVLFLNASTTAAFTGLLALYSQTAVAARLWQP
ncbi:Transmembrane protein [Quillaja saponaria]|uniref:Transmembrane protein n=1 Tax=Quillaja saponaria TaxID=32244 RepID=A0AAD7M5P3_QUISA|nr:Transmembrane protein [Quillaja saponaria]KAJ7970420.1 Transmembrane protein [Quillaja saponaria]